MLDKLMSYDTVGMSCYGSNIETVKSVSSALKAMKPAIKIVFGGPEVSAVYLESGKDDGVFKEYADFVVAGEGEIPLHEYLAGLSRGARFAAFSEIADPESLSAADYSDFDLSDYPVKNAVSLLTSRGCVRKCAFCSERLLFKGFRAYPVDTVIGEIRAHEKRGIKRFIFHDSLINGDIRSLEELTGAMAGTAGPVAWEAQIAVRKDMPDRLFAKIKQSGCYHLFVGLESGCGRILRKMNKGFTPRDAADFFRKLCDHGLSFGISLIVGFPGETAREMEESLDFIIANRDVIPKIEQVNPFVYYRGTDLPRPADYRRNKGSLERAEFFIDRLKQAGFKYTKAFMFNLVEDGYKPWK
ncbi:MAG: radical SAM protein [Candidatus Omnitrophota bacterium]